MWPRSLLTVFGSTSAPGPGPSGGLGSSVIPATVGTCLIHGPWGRLGRPVPGLQARVGPRPERHGWQLLKAHTRGHWDHDRSGLARLGQTAPQLSLNVVFGVFLVCVGDNSLREPWWHRARGKRGVNETPWKRKEPGSDSFLSCPWHWIEEAGGGGTELTGHLT